MHSSRLIFLLIGLFVTALLLAAGLFIQSLLQKQELLSLHNTNTELQQKLESRTAEISQVDELAQGVYPKHSEDGEVLSVYVGRSSTVMGFDYTLATLYGPVYVSDMRGTYCVPESYYYQDQRPTIVDFRKISDESPDYVIIEVDGTRREFEIINTVGAPGGDIATSVYAKDSEHVFYWCDVLPEADPQTFKQLSLPPIKNSSISYLNMYKTLYSTDDKHLYFRDALIKEADPHTFKLNPAIVSHIESEFEDSCPDEQCPFYFGRAMPIAIDLDYSEEWLSDYKTTFTYDAYDKNNYYLLGEVVEVAEE